MQSNKHKYKNKSKKTSNQAGKIVFRPKKTYDVKIVKPNNFYRLIFFKPFAHYNLKIKSRLPEDHVWEKQYVVFREKCIYLGPILLVQLLKLNIEHFHLERNQGDFKEFSAECLKNLIIKVRRFSTYSCSFPIIRSF